MKQRANENSTSLHTTTQNCMEDVCGFENKISSVHIYVCVYICTIILMHICVYLGERISLSDNQ